MALINKDHAPAFAQGAIVLDLGDLQKQGDAIIAQAQQKADEIIEAAKLERERLIEGAADSGRAEGFEQGKAEGHAEGRAEGHAEALAERAPELTVLTDRWVEALDKFESDRLLLLNQAADSVLEFATTFAQRVAKRAVELDGESARTQLDAALAMLLRPSRVVIVVHPEDRELIDEGLPAMLARFDEIVHAELLTDESLTPGSCVVRAGSEEVNADIDSQIQRLVDAVLPGRTADNTNETPGDALGDAA